jgi:hypothetical protein
MKKTQLDLENSIAHIADSKTSGGIGDMPHDQVGSCELDFHLLACRHVVRLASRLCYRNWKLDRPTRVVSAPTRSKS